jgi:ERCC4-type nuclease
MKPAEPLPSLVVDTREQTPLVFTRLPCLRGTLTTGDYSVAGCEELFAVERKSIPDLVASVTGERGRFERELHRLRGYRFKRLLIVGSRAEIEAHRYRNNASPRAVLASLAAFEVRYDLPVVWSRTPQDAAVLVEGWAWWFAREIRKAASLLGETPAAEGELSRDPTQLVP